MSDAKTGDKTSSESPPRRGSSKDGATFLLEEIPARSERSGEKFKAALAGSIAITLSDKNDRYRGMWEGARFQVKKDQDTESDCSITVTEKDLMKISDGTLNPQIALLSGKVTVSGNSSLGVYFFGLVAPRSSQAI